MLKIQSVQASLHQLDEANLPDLQEIHSCLATANNSFRAALRGSVANPHDPQ